MSPLQGVLLRTLGLLDTTAATEHMIDAGVPL
jgi:hypothetical protein